HRAAGPELAAACAKIGRCPTGGARMTLGFELKARQVIHAVGPRWQGGTDDEERLLAAAYTSSLDLAAWHRLASLAFPAISTGIYGFPLGPATRIAVETVRRHLEKNALPSKVIFAVFGSQAEAIYRKALAG
ncbi:MAG: macro domain-containing protein, partial [Kiloniellales bacterium]